jgi:hypothetical protein
MLVGNDWVWKVLVFGYSQDIRNVQRLKTAYENATIKNVMKENGFIHGVGLETRAGKDDTRHLKGYSLIDARDGIGAFWVNLKHSAEIPERKIYRAKKDRMKIFNPPYVLLKTGFDPKTFKLRAVYSEDRFAYTNAICGIAGKICDKAILLSLVGLLNSSAYAYLNLLLGSSSGIEREQGFKGEILSYPVTISEDIVDLTRQIQEGFQSELMEDFHAIHNHDDLIADLDQLILEKFGLHDDAFVDYALTVQIPMAAKNKVDWGTVEYEQLSVYANVFLAHFEEIFPNNEKYISCNIYTNIKRHYRAVEIVFSDTPRTQRIMEVDGDSTTIEMMSRFMIKRINEQFYQMRDIVGFSENAFYIIKTDEDKNWHPAMAKLDLADVLDEILTSGGGVE